MTLRSMINRVLEWLVWHLLVACVTLSFVNVIAGQGRSSRKHKSRVSKTAPTATPSATASNSADLKIIGKRIQFGDGSTIEADEVWKQGEDTWYRTGGVAQLVAREVRSVEPIRDAAKPVDKPAEASAPAENSKPPAPDSFWILLKGGARMKVDDIVELDEGTWYRRGNVSMFLERDRIERIERESALAAAEKSGWKQRDWTTGNARIDELIRGNGARFGVDPYLVF